MPKHKKFIESQKNAVTYRVINREMGASQYDDNAPKTIWIPKSDNAEPILPVPVLSGKKPIVDDRLYPSKGPRPDWDCDVVAALDDDFDYNDPSNILEDDFIAKADALSVVETENSKDGEASTDGSDFSDDASFNFSDCESLDSQNLFQRKPKSKKGPISQYSMTSAVTGCSESVKMFNEHFENIMKEYEEEEIGALDFDNIEGHLTDENPILEELNKEKDVKELTLGKYDNTFKKFVLNYAESEPKEKYVEIYTKGKIEYDCESILSTNSNIYNHPTLIKADYKKKSSETVAKPSINKLLDVNLELNKISEDEDSEEEGPERCSAICSIRPKNETPEERRERKKMLKAAKREQRMLKKESKVAFKSAKIKMGKKDINLQHNAGVKLL